MADTSPAARLRAAADRLEDLAKRAAFGWGADWTAEHLEDYGEVHAPGKRNMVGCEDPDVTALIATMDPATVLHLTAWLRATARNADLAMRPSFRSFRESLEEQATRVAGDHLHSLALADAVLLASANTPAEEADR